MEKLREFVGGLKLKGKVQFNKNLASYTRLDVGGEGDVFYSPAGAHELSYFLKSLPTSIPVTILGNGSNVLIRDGGIRGVVIKLGREFSYINTEGDLLKAGAASLNSVLCQICLMRGINSFAFASCIPGSVGGGVAMNAGSYGAEFGDLLLEVEAIDRSGKLHKVPSSEIKFSYRQTNLPPEWIILGAKFIKERGERGAIRDLMEKYYEMRLASQPVYDKTAGSTFKNPPAKKAWEHIRDVSGSIMKVGGALWSPKHLNFIINDGTASASDLESLLDETRRRVKAMSGIDMELEVKILGSLKANT